MINFPDQDHVLLNLNVADFKDEMFMANTAEYAQLGSSATKELKTRFYELFPPKTWGILMRMRTAVFNTFTLISQLNPDAIFWLPIIIDLWIKIF